MKKTYKEFQEQELEKTVSPKVELGSQSVSEGIVLLQMELEKSIA